MQAVPFSQVTIDDPFWSPRLLLISSTGLLHQWHQLEASGCINNFRITAGLLQGFHSGWFFADSDAYKWLDAAARFSLSYPDPLVNQHMDNFIGILEAAQNPDGYLYTYNQLLFPATRWQNLQIEHELYCHGHLIEAGIAHFETSKTETLLKTAIRAANLICDNFLGKGPACTPGHEEIEIALLRLYRLSGESKYLEMATQFLEKRGERLLPVFALNMLQENRRVHQRSKERAILRQRFQQQHPDLPAGASLPQPNQAHVSRFTRARFLLSGLFGSYFQQHAPIRRQHTAVGHAVRFAYLQTAIASLINLSGDYSLLPSLRQRWHTMVGKRMYVTGGIGSLPLSEGFGRDYELDPASAYAETCAALGAIYWNSEMTNLEQDAAHADLLERQLYNASLAGIGQSATCFLYNNPLENKNGLKRQDWFEIPCCPSNLARTWAALGGFLYSQSADTLWLHQYVGSQIEIQLADQTPFKMKLESSFPWQGQVSIQFCLSQPIEVELKFRVPSWCEEVHADVDGIRLDINLPAAQAYPPTASGYDPRDAQYVTIRRTWKPVEKLNIHFDMPIRINYPHPRVKSCRGKVAISRGPMVYCLEAEDNPEVDIFTAQLDPLSLSAQHDPRLGGIMALNGLTLDGQPLVFIPYAWWANRSDHRMTVYVACSG